MAQLTTGLAGRKMSFFGHDGIDRWTATKKVQEAASLPEDWGVCRTCGGDAIDPAVKEAYKAWEPVNPPSGEGWQIWETVSEGSPITPVFATAEELADWCVEHQPQPAPAARNVAEVHRCRLGRINGPYLSWRPGWRRIRSGAES